MSDMETIETSTVDMDILRAFLSYELWSEFKDVYKSYLLTPVGWELLEDISVYYESHKDPAIDPDTFRLWFRIHRHPTWKTDKHLIYATILDTLFNGDPVKPDILSSAARVRLLDNIRQAIDANDIAEVNKLTAELNNVHATDDPSSKLVSQSIEDLVNSTIRYGGLDWRLNDLNVACGPIAQGDFIIVGKRPETGGTSFLVSEFTHMLHQLPEGKNALLINNEEFKNKVMTRLVCSALNISNATLHADAKRYAEDWRKFLGTRRIDVMSDASISTFEIEKLLKTGDYGLIGINVLDKIEGPSRKLEDYQRLEQLGQWARRMALTYGPTIAIVQADPAADNMAHPEASMLYKTKTGLQQEADLLIMIGRTMELEANDERGIHIAKNKLPGTAKTNPKLRHLRTEVNFDIGTGRFTSKHF